VQNWLSLERLPEAPGKSFGPVKGRLAISNSSHWLKFEHGLSTFQLRFSLLNEACSPSLQRPTTAGRSRKTFYIAVEIKIINHQNHQPIQIATLKKMNRSQ